MPGSAERLDLQTEPSLGEPGMDPLHPHATRWDLAGAIAFAQQKPVPDWNSSLSYAFGDRDLASIHRFNDTHAHAQVLELLDSAICKARQMQHHLVNESTIPTKLRSPFSAATLDIMKRWRS
jgi:hypothetical protein